jgi:hypothetical protein
MRVLLCCLLLALTGCKTLAHGDMPKGLDYRTNAFEDTVRWGSLEEMVVFLKPKQGEVITVQEGLDNIRVTSYETSPLAKVNETRWIQTAVIKYVLTDRQVVRQLVDQQVWESDDEGETWYRANPVPRFD